MFSFIAVTAYQKVRISRVRSTSSAKKVAKSNADVEDQDPKNLTVPPRINKELKSRRKLSRYLSLVVKANGYVHKNILWHSKTIIIYSNTILNHSRSND